MVIPVPKKRKTSAIIEEHQLDQSKAFVQDLSGIYDSLWSTNPLMALHQRHKDNDAADPTLITGKDLGWILLDVPDSDIRQFRKSKEVVNVYEWLPSEGVSLEPNSNRGALLKKQCFTCEDIALLIPNILINRFYNSKAIYRGR